MKAPLALVLIGLVALFAQGVAALFVAPTWIPNLGLLLVVAGAIGLRSPASGVLVSGLLGYATDCLSGSLLGQHMLLSLGAFGAARVAATQLNLCGPIPQATFVAFLAGAHAGALWALSAFFGGSLGPPLLSFSELLTHALVSALAAPLVIELVVRTLAHLSGDDGQRTLRLEPRTLTT